LIHNHSFILVIKKDNHYWMPLCLSSFSFLLTAVPILPSFDVGMFLYQAIVPITILYQIVRNAYKFCSSNDNGLYPSITNPWLIKPSASNASTIHESLLDTS